MDQKNYTNSLIYIFLIAVLLAPRIPYLGSFSTLDEPAWLSMGANFYYAIGQREFQNTVYEYQPAVTTMWIVTIAMLIYFPEYRGLGQGYLDMEKGRLDPFLLQHGKDPLIVLHIARLVQTFVIVCLFLLLYYLLQYFISKPAALFGVVFASFDPFFLGQSRLLDHEAMLSLFVLISLLAFAIFLSRKGGDRFLLLSGVTAGLAQLTKSSAIAILVPVGILLLIQLFQERQQGFFKSVWRVVTTFILWLAVLIITYIVLWPGMWVVPGKMLYEVYGNAFSYAFQGARLKVTGELTPSQFGVNTNLTEIWLTTQVLIGRTTPVTWLGILAGIIIPFTWDREPARRNWQLFALLLSTAIAFILMIGIAQGRNSPHYILSSYLALNVFAGWAWFHLLEWFLDRTTTLVYVSLFILVALQIWSAVSHYPYYYTYRNPILYRLGWNQNFPQFPYGEGLELAARYLAQQPNAKDSVALAYYYRGCFSYFYPGPSVGFRPFWVDGEHQEDLLNAVQSSDYVVVYYALQGNAEKYAGFLQVLSPVRPMYEVWLHGYRYVVVYKVDDFPDTVFENLAR